MNIRPRHLFLGFLAVALGFASCKKKEAVDKQPTLSVSSSEELFNSGGGESEVTVTSNSSWNITNSPAWCTANASTTSGNGKITFAVQSNPATIERSVIFSVTSGSISKEIKIRQLGEPISDSIAPDVTGMNSNAVQLATKIKLGINIGNTLEAIGGETAWGNPKVTKAFVDFIKQSGFNAVRIPCSWDQYVIGQSTNQIKPEWLDRVKEVVQYCVDNGLYVILNIHWDGGWLDGNINSQAQASVIEKQKTFWKQIAIKMRDFDEHLMFAGSNEPPVESETQMNILLSYHQTFVNAVRSTGGRNSYRVLVVQGPSTDIDKTTTVMNALPTDPTPNRIMAEVHYYSPYQFCLMEEDASWGKMFYYWGKDYHSTLDPERNSSWGEESYVVEQFQKMKTGFVDKGIPVVLGEFSAMRRNSISGDDLALHLASRAHYARYVTMQAKANGMLPFYWDTGGLLSRSSNTVLDQQTLDALIQGAQ